MVARDATWSCGLPARATGRFHLVTRGSFSMGDQALPLHSCVYWRQPNAPPVLRALQDDSELVVVQFPDHALLHEVAPDMSRRAPQQIARVSRA